MAEQVDSSKDENKDGNAGVPQQNPDGIREYGKEQISMPGETIHAPYYQPRREYIVPEKPMDTWENVITDVVEFLLGDMWNEANAARQEWSGIVVDGTIVVLGKGTLTSVGCQRIVGHEYYFHTHPITDHKHYDRFSPPSGIDCATILMRAYMKHKEFILCASGVWFVEGLVMGMSERELSAVDDYYSRLTDLYLDDMFVMREKLSLLSDSEQNVAHYARLDELIDDMNVINLNKVGLSGNVHLSAFDGKQLLRICFKDWDR